MITNREGKILITFGVNKNPEVYLWFQWTRVTRPVNHKFRFLFIYLLPQNVN